MSDDPHDKVVTWNDVYYQTVDLAKEAEEQLDSDWGEEGHVPISCFEHHLLRPLLTYHAVRSLTNPNLGYFDQPVYSCITCAEIVGRPVGVCYGCYLECHLGHDSVVELFQRRKFRCDCPTLSEALCDCQLYQGDQKELLPNTLNRYTHNFQGIFCWCKRGYSADSNAVMINCFLCEDWFHNTCIQEDKRFIYPLTESDDVFVCKDCMDKAPILKNYAFLQAKIDLESSADVSKLTTKDSSSKFNSSLPSESSQEISKPSSNLELLHSSSTIPFEGTKIIQASKGETEEKNTSDATAEVIEGCKLRNPTLAGNSESKIVTHALFVPYWTKELCRCQSCISEYAKQDISFLLDAGLPLVETGEDVDITSTPASSTSRHEENGGTASGLTLAEAVRRSKRARPAPSTEIDILKGGLEAFAALPGHQAKGDVLHAYSEFSQELEKYFKKAADEGRVITASDIHQFFADLKAKRPRLS